MQETEIFFDALTNEKYDQIRSLTTKEAEFILPYSDEEIGGDSFVGFDDFLTLFKQFKQAFPNAEFKLHSTARTADFHVAAFTVTGRHTGQFNGVHPSGKKYRFVGAGVFKSQDEKISQVTLEFDIGQVFDPEFRKKAA